MMNRPPEIVSSVADRARRRALVRRGTRDGRVPPIDRAAGAPADRTLCERCGAVYRRKAWRRGSAGMARLPERFVWGLCPACVQVEVGQYFGRVLISGRTALDNAEAVVRRIQNVGRREEQRQPERRILSIDRLPDTMEVLTTSQKLAHRIVQSLCAAFGGRPRYAWSDQDGALQGVWIWNAKPAARPAPRAAGRRAPAPPLEIRGRGVTVDPSWRALAQRQLGIWASRHPDLAGLRITLTAGRHHRRGAGTASLHAALAGRTLHVTKEADAVDAAMREALRALGRELEPLWRRNRGAGRRAR